MRLKRCTVLQDVLSAYEAFPSLIGMNRGRGFEAQERVQEG